MIIRWAGLVTALCGSEW